MTDKEEPQHIEPENKLGNKIGASQNLKKFFTQERIAAAQKSIEEVQDKFIQNNLGEINKAIEIGRKAPSSQKAKDTFISLSFTHKGQAESLGYEVLALTLDSLANYSKKYLPNDPNANIIVNKHMDILQTILRENITDGMNTTIHNLLESLPELIEHFHPSDKA